jgi:hypothetical protein
MALSLGAKKSKAYISERCKLMVGKTEAEAIGTMYIDSKGASKPYSKADLAYDLSRGTLVRTNENNTATVGRKRPISPKERKVARSFKVKSKQWLVMKTEGPSSYGANRGMSAATRKRMTETKVVSTHASREEAVAAAITARDYECSFEDWAEDYYGEDAEPPFFSGDGENYDDDECIEIFLKSPEQQNAESEQNAKAAKRALKRPKKPDSAFAVKFGRVTNGDIPKGWLTAANDTTIFTRNPSQIAGSKVWEGNPDFMLKALKSVSNRNYLMRSFCLDGSSVSGAKYTAYPSERSTDYGVTWYTPTNLDDLSHDGSIVDCCHADFFRCDQRARTTSILLTTDALLEATGPATRSVLIAALTSVLTPDQCCTC